MGIMTVWTHWSKMTAQQRRDYETCMAASERLHRRAVESQNGSVGAAVRLPGVGRE